MKVRQNSHKLPKSISENAQVTLRLLHKLSSFDPKIHGQELMIAQAIGAEFGSKNIYSSKSSAIDRADKITVKRD
jgi:hypothetical protein